MEIDKFKKKAHLVVVILAVFMKQDSELQDNGQVGVTPKSPQPSVQREALGDDDRLQS